MKPKRIILIRHGQSEGNADRANYESTPDYSLNLTEQGRRQAQAAGERIKEIIGDETVYAYVSPFLRTRQTFREIQAAIEPNLAKSIEDPRIREMDWGHLRHPSENDEIGKERDAYGTFFYRVKDGESGADVFDRVSTFLETMHRDFKKPDYPENALVVTHGITLRIFLMRWFHWSVEEYENLRNPKNCQLSVMENIANGTYQLTNPLETSK